MVEKRYIVGLDEGTTSARALVYDVKTNKIVSVESQGFKQYYPENGWVEQDAEEIYLALCFAFKKAMSNKRLDMDKILAVGLQANVRPLLPLTKKLGNLFTMQLFGNAEERQKRLKNFHQK